MKDSAKKSVKIGAVCSIDGRPNETVSSAGGTLTPGGFGGARGNRLPPEFRVWAEMWEVSVTTTARGRARTLLWMSFE